MDSEPIGASKGICIATNLVLEVETLAFDVPL